MVKKKFACHAFVNPMSCGQTSKMVQIDFIGGT